MLRRFFDRSVHPKPVSTRSVALMLLVQLALLGAIVIGAWVAHTYFGVQHWIRLMALGFAGLTLLTAIAQIVFERLDGKPFFSVTTHGLYRLVFAVVLTLIVCTGYAQGRTKTALLVAAYMLGILSVYLTYRRLASIRSR
jgi:hypothetical protein